MWHTPEKVDAWMLWDEEKLVVIVLYQDNYYIYIYETENTMKLR